MKLLLASIVATSLFLGDSRQGQPASGVVMGRAVDAVTKRPLANTIVSIAPAASARTAQGTAASITRVITSGDGTFVFDDLPAGSFTLTATKPGYVAGAYGKAGPLSASGQVLELKDGEHLAEVTLELWKFAAIGGTVVDDGGEPLANMPVHALRRTIVAGHWQLQPAGLTTTDDRGRYRIWSLLPGQYVVAIRGKSNTVPAALEDAYTQGVRSGRPVPLGPGAAAGSFPLLSAGSRVGDWYYSAGDLASSTLLPIGDNGQLLVYPTTFYPAGSSPSSLVAVGAGDERDGINFRIAPVAALRVSGTILGPDGPSPNTGLTLFAGETEDSAEAVSSTISDASGRFVFLGITPGQYTIRALRVPVRPVQIRVVPPPQIGSPVVLPAFTAAPPPIPADTTLWTTQSLTVSDRDVSGLTVTLETGARVSGHIEFDGASPKPSADALRFASILIDRSDGEPFRMPTTLQSQDRLAQIDESGQVTGFQIPAGTYVIRPSPIPGWTFETATVHGRDAADQPFELGTQDISDLVVTFTDHPARLSGTARTETGADDVPLMVLLFPAESGAWSDYGVGSRRFRSASTGKRGVYAFDDVPSGSYFAVALRNEPLDWQDPETLKTLAVGATSLKIAAGQSVNQDLTVR